MQYTVEDISPVKKKINVTVPAGEVASSCGWCGGGSYAYSK